MAEEDKEEAPNFGRTVFKASIEGSSVNEGGDVSLEVSVLGGNLVNVVMQQGDSDNFTAVIDLALSQNDLVRFLATVVALLGGGTREYHARSDTAHGIVAEHLAAEIASLSERTPRFLQDLTAFLHTLPAPGTSWLRLDTLRMVAQWLRDDYVRIIGLLDILDQANDPGKGAADAND
jgi:hypothetical protein